MGEDCKDSDFTAVLRGLRRGEQYARRGWNGKGMFIELQHPDKNSKMTLPYIYMTTASGDRVPWVASQTDILSEDWIFVGLAAVTVIDPPSDEPSGGPTPPSPYADDDAPDGIAGAAEIGRDGFPADVYAPEQAG